MSLDGTKPMEGRPFIVTQPGIDEDGRQTNPIVFVDSWFLEFTGYTAREMLGRNCNFLQVRPSCFIRPHGITEEEELQLRNTAKTTVQTIVTTGKPDVITVINYTKDGRAFRNTFMIEVHKDKQDSSINFFVARHAKERSQYTVPGNTHLDILRYVDIVVFEPPITTLPR
jgi:hypothetical protein